MKTAKELAVEIAETLYECTKHRADESNPTGDDDGIPYESDINPTVFISKPEVRKISGRKVVRKGFLDEVVKHLDDRLVDATIQQDGTLKCKGNYFQTEPAQYNSLSSVKESNEWHRKSNEDDEE